MGNKSDITDSIKVTKEEIDSYCNQHNNMPYFATSAKDNINLDDAFEKVGELACKRNTKNNENENFIPTNNVKIGKQQKVKKKTFC